MPAIAFGSGCRGLSACDDPERSRVPPAAISLNLFSKAEMLIKIVHKMIQN